jgi:flagellar hook-basal body complex protein FliE
MTAPIAPIGAISSATAAPAAAAPAATGTSSGVSFAQALGRGLDAVQGAQANADNLAVLASTGQLTDPSQYTIAATQASLMTQMATTLENKAVTSFNTIMGMQA